MKTEDVEALIEELYDEVRWEYPHHRLAYCLVDFGFTDVTPGLRVRLIGPTEDLPEGWLSRGPG